MINTVRFAATLSLLASAASPALLAADSGNSANNPPPIVIERAPEADAAQLQADLAAARAENQRLLTENAALKAKASNASTPVTTAPDASLAATEKTRADEAIARLNTLTVGVERLLDEKNAAEAQVAELRKNDAALREQLAAAEKAAAGAASTQDLSKKLAETEKKLDASLRSYSLLQAENQLLKTSSSEQIRLSTELEKMRQEKAVRDSAAADAAKVYARLTETEGKLATVLNSYSQLQRENDQLKTAPANNTAGQELEQLRNEKTALAGQLATLRETEANLRQQLAAAEKATASKSPDLSGKLAEAEAKLADAARTNVSLQRENDQLKAASNQQAALNAEIEKLRSDKAAADAQVAAMLSAESALRDQLTSAQQAASAASKTPATTSDPAVSKKLADTEARLETVLRSFTQLQAENDRLKTAGADQSKLTAEIEDLRRENTTLQSRLAATPPDNSTALAATEDKLNTVLRSFTLLQNENDRLKADAARAVQSAESSSSRAANESAAQLSALFDELRQTQAQSTSLAFENSQLKTRLALAGNPPGASMASPVRPGSARAGEISNEAPSPASAAVTPAPAAESSPRSHHVVAGDSLTKLARTYYGNPSRWDEILNANREVIKDQNVLPIGATLRIP